MPKTRRRIGTRRESDRARHNVQPHVALGERSSRSILGDAAFQRDMHGGRAAELGGCASSLSPLERQSIREETWEGRRSVRGAEAEAIMVGGNCRSEASAEITLRRWEDGLAPGHGLWRALGDGRGRSSTRVRHLSFDPPLACESFPSPAPRPHACSPRPAAPAPSARQHSFRAPFGSFPTLCHHLFPFSLSSTSRARRTKLPAAASCSPSRPEP